MYKKCLTKYFLCCIIKVSKEREGNKIQRLQDEKIIEEVKKFYNDEIKDVKVTKEYHENLLDDYKKATIQRGLGVSFFVQYLGIDFETIEPIYMEFREKVEEI